MARVCRRTMRRSATRKNLGFLGFAQADSLQQAFAGKGLGGLFPRTASSLLPQQDATIAPSHPSAEKSPGWKNTGAGFFGQQTVEADSRMLCSAGIVERFEQEGLQGWQTCSTPKSSRSAMN
jgi:hypothetical protein